MSVENKKATTIDEQVQILQERGMVIDDEKKLKEHLLDIGYYRLGFYWFPFEKTYPRLSKRDHNFKEGTNVDYAIKLYYFDFDLRNIFMRYISRIEINFRTKLIYYASNEYPDNPFWYVDEKLFKKGTFENDIYQKALRDVANESVIKKDKSNHGNRDYAPAWKALEYMSFGAIILLYENLLNNNLKCRISNEYGISSPNQFQDYINTVRRLRNSSAHGKVLYDQNLPQAIGNGPLGNLGNQKTTLAGAYMVFKYFLNKISENRVTEMRTEIIKAFDRVSYAAVKDIIVNNSGLSSNII